MFRFFVPITFLFAAVTLFPPVTTAHEFQAGDLFIDHPWARATIGRTPNGSAYLTIHNRGETADRLIGVAVENAEKAELHQHIRDGDVMRMRPVTGGLPLAAGGRVAFAPGGYHIMLFGLTSPLIEGESFPMRLSFEKAGEVEVTVKIESAAYMPAAAAHGH